MAIIRINNHDVVISISESDYINHNKEYIDETISYFIDDESVSGKFGYYKEDDIERENLISIEWEILRTKEQLIEDLESMISEINTRTNELNHDYSKSSSISRVIDRLELAITEINERF